MNNIDQTARTSADRLVRKNEYFEMLGTSMNPEGDKMVIKYKLHTGEVVWLTTGRHIPDNLLLIAPRSFWGTIHGLIGKSAEKIDWAGIKYFLISKLFKMED